jgi:putrescine transport system substrate-binding protein
MINRYRVALLFLSCTLELNAFSGGKSSSDGASGNEKAVNVLIWARVLAPKTLADFEKQTGIKIHASSAVSQEDLETRILAGNSGFDLASPGADYFQRQIKAGGYLPLNKSKLRYLKNLDPQLMGKVSIEDPNNAYGIIYFWGTSGIGYTRR